MSIKAGNPRNGLCRTTWVSFFFFAKWIHLSGAFSAMVHTKQSSFAFRSVMELSSQRSSEENINDLQVTMTSSTRRGFLSSLTVLSALLGSDGSSNMFAKADDPMQVSEEELDSLYENPAIPEAPEERSGLVVLRVAEVAQFQEKILRAVASGELNGVKVSPMQFVFGTKILLKNSNLDGNLKLMIYEEIPKNKRDLAIKNAVSSMNQLQDIIKYASSIQRDFETEEMVQLADMYRGLRISLNQLYEFLPEKEKDKYYGYFVAVTEYEKKIAEGVYNPDIDGVLKFD